MSLSRIVYFLLLFASVADAQEIPSGGQSMIAAGAFERASFYSQAGIASRTWSDAEQAWRVAINKTGQNAWDAELRITEFVVNLTDRELQADYLRDFFIAVYSHPVVVGIQMWGFWEGAHWRPDAALYNLDWTPRPAAEAFRQLVWEDWTTESAGETGAGGEFAFRGTFGEYAVTIEHAGNSIEQTIFLTRDGLDLTLAIDSPAASSSPAIRMSPGGTIQLFWLSAAGSYKWLESSPDLSEWIRETEYLDGPQGPVTFPLDAPVPAPGVRFFRLLSEGP
jgi:hypothetical protein